jgi:hypothetical protein
MLPSTTICKEQVPDNLPREENQEPPEEDERHCPVCKNLPCLFLQYQDKLERHVDIIYRTNKGVTTCTTTCLKDSMAIWARANISSCLNASLEASGNCSHRRIM